MATIMDGGKDKTQTSISQNMFSKKLVSRDLLRQKGPCGQIIFRNNCVQDTESYFPPPPICLQRFIIHFGVLKALRSSGIKQFVYFPLPYFPKFFTIGYYLILFFIEHIFVQLGALAPESLKTKLGLLPGFNAYQLCDSELQLALISLSVKM